MEVSFNGILRVWQRNFDVYKRFFVNRLLTSALYPLLFLLAMGYGLGKYVGEIDGVEYIRFIAPALIASSAMFAASFSTTFGTYIKMRYQKTFQAIISTPISIDSVIVGEILWGATRALIDGMIIYTITSLFGLASFPMSLLLIPFSFLFGVVFSLLGVLITALIKHIDQFDYYFNCFISLMFLFSGTFFPLSRMPQVVQKFAWFLPLTHGIQIVRPVFLGTFKPELLLDILWLIGLIIILFPIVLLRLRVQILKYS